MSYRPKTITIPSFHLLQALRTSEARHAARIHKVEFIFGIVVVSIGVIAMVCL